MIWWDQKEWKTKAWRCPHGTSQHISRRLKHLSLGCPRYPLHHQQITRSSLVILYFNSVTSYMLYLERLCVFYFCFVLLWINWILAFMCGRETRSAFSCEYSYSSLISVEYSCLVTIMISALVFHAYLVRAVCSFMLDYTLLFHAWTCSRVLCSNKLIGVSLV